MMNNSNGFQNNSLLGSSTGFKKRNLLRPPSGMLNKKQEFLKAIDISQSEPAIATLVRSQVASIDQEIHLLDKDKRIRQGEGGLQKSYVTTFRKWLRENQSFGEKQDDDMKILKHMGTDSYQAGFRKLWKIVCHLDLAINKVSQLEIVHFLLYDEMFDDIGKDTLKSTELLSRISNNGYNSGTFQISQILLDRQKDVYASCKKTGSINSNFSKTKEQSKNRQEANELIADLKRQNAKLTSLLEQLSAERDNDRKKHHQKENNNTRQTKEVKTNSGNEVSLAKIIKELQQKYIDQIKYLSSQKARAEETVIDLRSKLSSSETQLKSYIESSKVDLGPKPKSGSYEQALVEQMQKMKRGFERKIAVMNEQYTTRERELRKKENEYKVENQKIKWQKSLLLKKFQMIPLR